MKKSIFSLLLAGLLITFAACGNNSTEESASPDPSEAPTQNATETPTETDGEGRSAEAELIYTLEGEEERVPGKLRADALETGENIFSLYVDLENYDYDVFENCASVVAKDAMGETYLELKFTPNTTNRILHTDFISGYLDADSTSFDLNGNVGIDGSLSCYIIRAKNGEYMAAAFLTETRGGVISAVIKCPLEAEEGHFVRLSAMLDTLEIY